MKILIDIGHPAHVHYFRNFIKIMENKGHSFLVTARDKEVAHSLLNNYKIIYIDRGKGYKSLLGKLIYMFKADFLLLKLSLKFEADVFLSFSSPYAAQVAWFLRKSHIAFDDTEHAKLEHMMYVPFTDVVLTPKCFQKDFGKKHIRFNSFMELCYLHPNYFTPDPSVLELLGVEKGEKYVILRFVSWGASHDIGQSGLTLDEKNKLVKTLSKYVKVFITSEEELIDDMKKYEINIFPHQMHDAIAYASLVIGEGATMASESAMLGTPAIYINTITAGTIQEQEEGGLLYRYCNAKGLMKKALDIIQTPNIKTEYKNKQKNILSSKIDVTAFMVWFVENYPNSEKIMKEKPNYQYNFK